MRASPRLTSQEAEKMTTPPTQTANKAAEAQREYMQWDRNYTYYQLGFTPKLI
jgi:hypothetical protein